MKKKMPMKPPMKEKDMGMKEHMMPEMHSNGTKPKKAAPKKKKAAY